MCKICSKRHHTSVHGFLSRPKESDYKVDVEKSESCYSISHGQVISMCVVPVRVRHQPSNKTFETIAMLDSCSQATFVTKNLIEKLGISGRKTPLRLKSINDTERTNFTVIEGLVISSAAKIMSTCQKYSFSKRKHKTKCQLILRRSPQKRLSKDGSIFNRFSTALYKMRTSKTLVC